MWIDAVLWTGLALWAVVVGFVGYRALRVIARGIIEAVRDE